MAGIPRLRAFLRSVAPFLVGLPLVFALQALLAAWGRDDLSFLLVSIGVNVILAVSLNVVNGFTGQFSLGHAGFMAVGAYTAAKITLALADVQLAFLPGWLSDQVFFALALSAGMLTAAIAGVLVGMPSLRLRGDYLAIVTLGFGEIIRSVIENMRFLGQATGLSGLPRLTSLTWVGAGVIATVVMARRLALSSQGRALFAIREDEVAAEAMGVDTTGYKVRAFVIAAAYAGLAGGLIVHVLQLATPRSFTFIRSIEVVAFVVLGGLGSVTGSILSAAVLTWLLEQLRDIQQYRMVGYALLLIVLMLLRPQGIFGTRELWDLPLFRRLPRPKPFRGALAGTQGAAPTETRDDRGEPGGTE
jgi:branched-chain amino acid transport system permease protein